MSLLTNVMDHSLDDGYAEAAARREADGQRGPAAHAAGEAGACGGSGAGRAAWSPSAPREARISAPVAGQGARGAHRPHRAEDIGTRTSLRAEVDTLRDDVERDASGRRWRSTAGTRASWWRCCPGPPRCTGPGVKLVVDDAKEHRVRAAADRGRAAASPTPGRVRDRDMQRVVNGLWAVGRGGHLHQRAAADGALGDQGRGRRHTGRQQAAGAAVHGARGGGRDSGSAPRSRTAPTASTCRRCRTTTASAPASPPRTRCGCRPRRA